MLQNTWGSLWWSQCHLSNWSYVKSKATPHCTCMILKKNGIDWLARLLCRSWYWYHNCTETGCVYYPLAKCAHSWFRINCWSHRIFYLNLKSEFWWHLRNLMPSNPPPTHSHTQQSQILTVSISICALQAAHMNLTSPRYVWISHGWYPNQWWTQAVANEAINCSDAQLEAFLAKSRTLAVNHLPAPTDSNAESVAGIVSCGTTLCMQQWNGLALFQYKLASNRSDLHSFECGNFV